MYNQQCCKSSENKMELKSVPSSSSKIELKSDPSSTAKMEQKSVQDPLILELVPILVKKISILFCKGGNWERREGEGGWREVQLSKLEQCPYLYLFYS